MLFYLWCGGTLYLFSTCTVLLDGFWTNSFQCKGEKHNCCKLIDFEKYVNHHRVTSCLAFQGSLVRSWRRRSDTSAALGTSLPPCWLSSVWASFDNGVFKKRVCSGCQDRPTWSKSCRMPSTVGRNHLLIGKGKSDHTVSLNFLSDF